MPLYYDDFANNPKWVNSTTIPAIIGPNNTFTIGPDTLTANDLARRPDIKGKTILLYLPEDNDSLAQLKAGLQSNIDLIQYSLALSQQIQTALLSQTAAKLSSNAIAQSYDLQGVTTVPFDAYVQSILNKNPTLTNNIVLDAPIPGALDLSAANQLSQYLDQTQFLTVAGAPIKNRTAKIDRNYSDPYYYLEYPYYKAIETFHQSYLMNTTRQYVDLSFINELRFTGLTADIEMNMNRLNITNQDDLHQIMGVKLKQFQSLKKIVISKLNGDVRIVRGAFDGYTFPALESIEFSNISGRVIIENGAFANTSMPLLNIITFNDIAKGLVIEDNAFSTPVLPSLTNIVLACIQYELTVGNNVFPANLMAQISTLGFKSNTGNINILDAALKKIIKLDCDSTTRQGGYSVYDDEFKWLKNKLLVVEELVRAGFSTLIKKTGAIDTIGGSGGSSSSTAAAASTSEVAIQTTWHKIQVHSGHTVVALFFLGVSGVLLYYVIRHQTSTP